MCDMSLSCTAGAFAMDESSTDAMQMAGVLYFMCAYLLTLSTSNRTVALAAAAASVLLLRSVPAVTASASAVASYATIAVAAVLLLRPAIDTPSQRRWWQWQWLHQHAAIA